MNAFLGMGIFLFVGTILFAIAYISSLPDVITEEIKNVADNISYVNSALWILSIILSSIGMKKRRDVKQEEKLRKEKNEINLTRVDRVVTEQDEEIKKLKEKVGELETDKDKIEKSKSQTDDSSEDKSQQDSKKEIDEKSEDNFKPSAKFVDDEEES